MSVTEVAVIDLEQKASTLVEQARALIVNNQRTYELAAERLLGIASLGREIEQHYAPLKQKAHEAHKAICAAEAKMLSPVQNAAHIYKAAISAYESEQRRREAEARAKAEAEARRQAEEQREHELLEAEDQGADAAEITAMMNEPLVVAPARVEPAFQAARGITTAITWKGEVTSLVALVKAIAAGKANINLVMPNESAINQLARSTAGSLQVEGIRFHSQPVVRAGRR